jgi:hypothetical protein
MSRDDIVNKGEAPPNVMPHEKEVWLRCTSDINLECATKGKIYKSLGYCGSFNERVVILSNKGKQVSLDRIRFTQVNPYYWQKNEGVEPFVKLPEGFTYEVELTGGEIKVNNSFSWDLDEECCVPILRWRLILDTNQYSGGWIKNTGVKPDLPKGTIYEIKFRNGRTHLSAAEEVWNWESLNDYGILAYRVVKLGEPDKIVPTENPIWPLTHSSITDGVDTITGVVTGLLTTGGWVSSDALDALSYTMYENKFFNTNEESKMRKLVTVQLIDNDKGLDVADSLILDIEVMTEDDAGTTIREILMNPAYDVSVLLEEHNNMRADIINKEILNRTGQEVKLQPVKLKDLTWMFDGKVV